MRLYDVIFNEEKDKGIYCLSVVENPAMEEFFIALNQDEKPESMEVKLAKVDEEQRILMGVALIPNKPIYRNNKGDEFYIQFSEETIKKAAHSFLKNQYNNNSTIEHEVSLSAMSVVESWIIEDEFNDKSVKYGLSYPKGSWMVAMKVDNDEVWDEYVKTGKITGFSIDGIFSLQEVKLKEENMDNTMKITKAIEQGFINLKEMFTTKIELATATLADGETVVEYEGDLAIGSALFVVVEDGDNLPAPDADHVLESGMIVQTVDGLVTEITEAPEVEEEAAPEGEVELASEIKEIITWSMQVINTTFAEGDVVESFYEGDDEANSSPVGAGEFELSDGRRIVTDASGVIVEIKPAMVVEDEVAPDAPEDSLEAVETALSSQLNDFKVQFQAEIKLKDDKIKQLELELSTTPASKPRKHSPIDVQLSEPKTRMERMERIIKNSK
tara:strand:- start:10255 stop:11583 length:1329 start_codon:yes stop_codon:yes gene_type:complete